MHLSIDSMPIVPLFLFKLSVSLTVVWCFYQVVLRRLTFYKLNRWYLFGYTLLSFFIPLINIGPMIPEGPAGEPIVIQYIPAIGSISQTAVLPVQAHTGMSGWTVLLWVLAAGSVLLLARVIVRWVSLIRLRRKARLIGGNGVKIYQVDGPVIPFSFGNAIYINQDLHTEREWEDIILHEYVHIRQRHTIDILIAELVCVVNWYNPFAWLIRYSIRQNLEFIADQQVLDKGVDRKGYQYHLLKVMGEPRYLLANNFNFSSLKKRIVMMNKMRSARVQLLKLLFLLPLVAVLLAAFRDRYDGMPGRKASGQINLNVAGIIIVLPDRTPIGGVAVRDEVSGVATKTDERGFYRLRIPAMAGSPLDIHLNYYKEGYDSGFTGWSQSVFKETTGILNLGFVIDSTKPRKGTFIAISDLSRHRIPAEPGYEDAIQEMNRVFDENDRLQRYMQLQKDHPDIGLFYVTEDRQKEIVIHTDGTVEKYGYPGTPGLDKLYKKYGEMHGYMATSQPLETPGVNAGYLARWAAIGEQAQRDFHTTSTTVRAIIFPGDSRVIAVPVTGKPRFYDMDNDASNERAEFERLYGKLPACVPKAGFNSDEMERKDGWPPRQAAGGVGDTVKGSHRDTIPGGRKDSLRAASVGAVKLYLDSARHRRPLFLVDGREVPQDTLNTLYPDRSLNTAPHGSGDSVIRLGGVEMSFRDKETQRPVTLDWGRIFDRQPIWVIDGKEEPRFSIRTLNPDRIKAIQVLRDSVAMSKYGERGENGVVILTLK